MLTERQLEKVSPSWMEPKEEGSVRSSVGLVRSLRVFGWPGRGSGSWREVMAAVEWAWGEVNGQQEITREDSALKRRASWRRRVATRMRAPGAVESGGQRVLDGGDSGGRTETRMTLSDSGGGDDDASSAIGGWFVTRSRRVTRLVSQCRHRRARRTASDGGGQSPWLAQNLCSEP